MARCLVAAFVFVGAFCPLAVFAQLGPFFWTGGGSSDINDAANWTPADRFPNSGDLVFDDRSADPVAVRWDDTTGDTVSGSLTINGRDVSFLGDGLLHQVSGDLVVQNGGNFTAGEVLGGINLRANSTTVTDGSRLNVIGGFLDGGDYLIGGSSSPGNEPVGESTLSISARGELRFQSATIGPLAGSGRPPLSGAGKLVVTGAGTEVDLFRLIVGYGDFEFVDPRTSGHAEVSGGATLSADLFTLGGAPGDPNLASIAVPASLRVSGPGSKVISEGEMVVGGGSGAAVSVDVERGGRGCRPVRS